MEKFKQKVKKFLKVPVLAVVALVLVFSSVYTIDETESAIVTTFGKAALVEEKGLKFKIPFIQQVTKVNTTIQGISIGYAYDDYSEEYYTIESESTMITADYNFIDCDFYISYQVTDPIKFVYNSEDPAKIVKNLAMSCIRSVISSYNVDAALTTGKAEIQSNVKAMLISELEEEDIGITLVDASIQDVEPPTDEVIAAFTAVETAKQAKESAINEANKYRNEQLPNANAKADKILQDANATKTARINEANGLVARFTSEYAEYKNFPLITKQRMFYETMGEVLPNLTIIINDDESGNILKLTDLDKKIKNSTAADNGGAE